MGSKPSVERINKVRDDAALGVKEDQGYVNDYASLLVDVPRKSTMLTDLINTRQYDAAEEIITDLSIKLAKLQSWLYHKKSEQKSN